MKQNTNKEGFRQNNDALISCKIHQKTINKINEGLADIECGHTLYASINNSWFDTLKDFKNINFPCYP